MISKHILKEIITTNEEFILRHTGNIVGREGVLFPETVRKVVVFYGVSIPTHSGHPFRFKSATYSDSFRPLIPI